MVRAEAVMDVDGENDSAGKVGSWYIAVTQKQGQRGR
jgi:hypothetical protein